ncbi:MAG: AmmeMemoRadiSam system protein A [Patescibacteria group bacterium]
MLNLSPIEKEELLSLARKAIAAKLEGNDLDIPTDNPNFSINRGVFVTLMKNNELRGCIGNIESRNSVWQGVIENATAAAFEDPRFLPLQAEELSQIQIEISILSEPELAKPEYLKPGIDGVVIKCGENKATYLPQVWEHFKTKEEFMDSLCVKAGLAERSWQDPRTQVFTYQVEKFSE